ncbi:ketopantoate hydroxymethyltransferase [Cohnella abietis]|uniref:Ketopantoate hydroxymethyltransferase n=1 Tax=Cohnella abietis TaxID=2507935 RepID=A0A3T1D1T7_9BACL|nr:ketopantoate hydroxymethyltransferase [Cohnella abietis]BBI32056.1 hypothetical protein KCTCHS21_14550 [Cohnella abietis]
MIKQSYLHELAQYTKDKITKLVVNDVLEITDFNLKEVDANNVELEAVIPFGAMATVTKIELKGSMNDVIATKTVFLPIVEDTIIQQVITFVEVL